MSVTADWYHNMENVLYVKFEAPWTWDEYVPTAAQIRDMIEASGRDGIDVLIDVHDSGAIPRDAASQMRQFFSSASPKTRTYVVVGAALFAKILFETLAKVYTTMGGTRSMYFTSSLEEAEAILQKQPDLQ